MEESSVRQKVRQIGYLYGATITSMVLGVLISAFNARILGPEGFGNLRFILFSVGLLVTVSSLGLYVSSQRLIAIEEDVYRQRQIVGASGVLVLVISFVLGLLTVVIAGFIKNTEKSNIYDVLIVIAPIVWAYPLQSYLENILQAGNYIKWLAMFRFVPQLLYLIVVYLLKYYAGQDITLVLVLVLQSLMLGCSGIIIILMLRPKFNGLNIFIKKIYKETRMYGVYVYTASIVSVGAGQLGPIVLGFTTDTKSVGFLALAMVVTSPLTLVASSIGTVYYKGFAKMRWIPRGLMYRLAFAVLLMLLVFEIAVQPIIMMLYQESYLPVVDIARVVAIGAAAHGIGDFFNRYLGANGHGKMIRNGALIVGVLLVLGYAGATAAFGIWGAAITIVIADVVYALVMIYGYKKVIREFKEHV